MCEEMNEEELIEALSQMHGCIYCGEPLAEDEEDICEFCQAEREG